MNIKKIARYTLAKHTTHGLDKKNAKLNGTISSIGTERSYRQCYSNYLEWCKQNLVHPDFRANRSTLVNYLEERREWIKQKTLNQERQSLQLVYKQKLPYLHAIRESVYDKRSYTMTEVNSIVVHQTLKNATTTWLAFYGGLRAHEPATILPIEERPASSHRNWDSRRFNGLPPHRLYTVQGKGKLVREVAIPLWLSIRLEKSRRITPIEIIDREIIYLSWYDVGIGQSWSQSFTSASKKALQFSRGGHGLRHSFAKWRLQHLIDWIECSNIKSEKHTNEELALLLLSQLLGHFRLDIMYCYLR